MSDSLSITSDTEIELVRGEIQDVHLKDLSFVLDIERDGDDVTRCTVDLDELIQAMTVYSSMEKFRYDWR